MPSNLSADAADLPPLLRLRHKNAALAFEFALLRWGRAIERASYNLDQPRAPAGGSDGGQWTSGDDSPVLLADNSLGSSDPNTVLSDAPPSWADGREPNLGNFGPDKPGYHDYTVGPTLVCTSKIECTPQEMVDWLSRYAYPGQDPSKPVVNDGTYDVYDPRTDLYAGKIRTVVSPDGLTVINRTLKGHIFFDGQIARHAVQAPNGSWFMTTHGIGNNENRQQREFGNCRSQSVAGSADFPSA